MNKDIFARNLFLFYITMQHGAASIQDILLFSVILIGLTLLILSQDLKLKRAAAVIFLGASLFCSLFFCSGGPVFLTRRWQNLSFLHRL